MQSGDSKDTWTRTIKGFLVDITGVLYDSGGGAIPGSIEAVRRLYSQSNVRFVSNETTGTREGICEKLRQLGFDMIQPQHIFTPAPVAARYVMEHGLKAHLLVHPGVLPEFEGCRQSTTDNPNNPTGRPCVVLGDAEDGLSFDNMNAAFRVLLDSPRPLLISLGNGKFYQRADCGPCLDTGAYAALLKFALDGMGGGTCEHVVVGKPEEAFFMSAVEDMGLARDQVVMLGDDILGDVKGAQKVGIRGIQLRTGKWRPEWETHPDVKPDMIADDLGSAIATILNSQLGK